MKLKSLFLCAVIPIFLLSGCAFFHNPLGAFNKAEDKKAAVQKKLDKNDDETVDAGKKYIYGTKLALAADPSTNKAHVVATDLNDKAIAVLGQPSLEEINNLKQMVNNLLATNKAIIIKGEKQLADLDSEVIDLQSQKVSLEGKLDTAEKKLTAVSLSNAGLAQKWATLTKIFWGIVYFFIAAFVIKILAAIVPPPYNTFVGIIAVPFGLITKAIHACIPEAKVVAGVVSKDYQTATEHLVSAIQDIKTQNPSIAPQIAATVVANTDSTTSAAIINTTKTALGIVS